MADIILDDIIQHAKIGRLEMVKFLINVAGFDVNKIYRGCSALFSACIGNQPDVVKFLLEAGADPNFKVQGWSALSYAGAYGYEEIVKLLVNAGADPKWKNIRGQSALSLAKEKSFSDIVKILESQPVQKSSEPISSHEKKTLKITNSNGEIIFETILNQDENINISFI